MVKIWSKGENRLEGEKKNTLGQVVGEDGIHSRGASNPAQRARKRGPGYCPIKIHPSSRLRERKNILTPGG